MSSSDTTSASQIQDLLKSAIPDIVFMDLKDTSNGCGQCYELILVSSIFEGKQLLQRHKLVNEALKDVLPSIHAFSQKTWTPSQWEEKKPKE